MKTGDLVHFRYHLDPESPAPDVQIIERTPRERVHQDDIFTRVPEKERLRVLREVLKATQPDALYLVLTASEKRALLLSLDAKTFLVAFTKDIRQL